MTVCELVEKVGVTRTAVTEQLNELAVAGYVERTMLRSSKRGRPRHLYRATNLALQKLFVSCHALLVPAMQRAIVAIGNGPLLRKTVDHVSAEMADHYGRMIKSKKPVDRMRELAGLLSGEGVIVDFEQAEDVCRLRKRTCPFISMHDESDFVCLVDNEMISQVVERPIKQVHNRHEDGVYCAFEMELSNGDRTEKADLKD